MKTKLLAALLLLSAAAAKAQQASDTAATEQREVVVSGSRGALQRHVESTQMGKVDLPVTLLTKAPSIGGERDVIKALQMTPGVKRGSEAGIGMYVRGGGNDENLILLDDATVYNAGHLLGLFSVFNAPVLREVNMYKSSFPAQYGGRLSSVLDVKTKEGSMQEYHGEGSLGLISSNLTLQGPIINNRLSFLVSGRRTYIDKVFTFVPYHFYDVNARLSYRISPYDRLSLSFYKGDDRLKGTGGTEAGGSRLSQDFGSGMTLGNTTGSLHWNHSAADSRRSSHLALVYSNFRYNVSAGLPTGELSVRSSIRDMGLRGEISDRSFAGHHITLGGSFINHYFNPNIINSEGEAQGVLRSSEGRRIVNNEMGLHLADDWKVSGRWQLMAGVRLSASYAADKFYVNPEPRLAARYLLNERSSIKASYARMTQYMHLVSSSSVVLPTDLWYPVTATIKPGISDQLSLGYYHSIPDLGIALSAEGYYKWLQNQVEYREGARLIFNDEYERELLQGTGRGYGLELFASKTSGRFTGWLGYTLSWAQRSFDGLNGGKEFYARYDRRHDFSLVGNYEISKHWAVSSSVLYASGSPFTAQISQYVAPDPTNTKLEAMPVYSERNAMRLSPTFRIDMDLQYKFKLGGKTKGEVHLSVYNLLNRTQPGRVSRIYDDKTAQYKYQQRGMFGTLPTLSVNFTL